MVCILVIKQWDTLFIIALPTPAADDSNIFANISELRYFSTIYTHITNTQASLSSISKQFLDNFDRTTELESGHSSGPAMIKDSLYRIKHS